MSDIQVTFVVHPSKGLTEGICGCEKGMKVSWFCVNSYFIDGTFTAVNRDVKGVPFVDRRHTKGVPSRTGFEKILVQ